MYINIYIYTPLFTFADIIKMKAIENNVATRIYWIWIYPGPVSRS